MEWHLRNRMQNRLSFTTEDIRFPLTELWSLTLPDGIIDTPIYAEGSIFVITTKELYKLDPLTGKTIWNIKPGTSLQSSPAYYDGKVYFSSHNRNIFYCVDSKNGKEIWRMDPGGSAGSCCFDGNDIFLKCKKRQGENKVSGYASYTLDGLTEKWFHACDEWVDMRACAIAAGILVYGDTAGNVYGLEVSTGREVWKMKISDWIPIKESKFGEKEFPHVSEVPVVIDEKVIISVETPGQTFCLDLKSGKVLWFYNAPGDERWRYYAMGLDENQLYFLNMDQHNPKQYISVDIKTGKVKMKVDISAYKEQLGLMSLSSRTGLVIGNFHFAGVYEPPRVVAFNKTTGEIAWTHSLDRSKLRGDSTGIHADGKLIWVRGTGDIYCFE